MHRKLYLCLALAVITLAVFWRVTGFDFVNYDDPDYVTANPIVQQGVTSPGLRWAFQNVHGERTYWHPITWVSHMLDCQFFGLQPAGHHLGNLLFHTANALLLFLVLNAMTGTFWRSALVAALFALHPLQVDTVAWITERKNVLSTFFLLLCLGAYVRYAAQPGLRRYGWVVLIFALALMCKPAVVTLPCLLLLLDGWPLQRFRWGRSSGASDQEKSSVSPALVFPEVPLRRLILEKIPLLALSFASSAITILAHQRLGLLGDTAQLSLRLRVENAVVSYARYLGKTFWPQDLAVLYPHPGKWPLWTVVAGGLVLLVITSVAVRDRARRPYLIVGWLWFLGLLVPAIGLVQAGVQAMADRFAYVPIIGLFIMVAWAGAELVSPLRRQTGALLAGAVLSACILGTSLQLSHWRNSITLWEHTLAVTRNNYMGHHDLGVALREAGRLDEASRQFTAALLIKTNALTYLELSRVRESESETNEAILHLQQAVQLAPQWAQAQRRLAFLLWQQGRFDEALRHYTELLRQTPSEADTRCEVAALLIARDRIAEGQDQYREVLRQNPNHLATLNNLAWSLGTSADAKFRRGPEAVELATRACSLTAWKNAQLIGTLAAALAEVGNFSQAADLAGQAVVLMMTAGDASAAAEHEAVRKMYLAGKPYRAGGTK